MLLTACGRRWISSTAFRLTCGLVSISLPWGAGLLYFLAIIPNEIADTDSYTDAIVILTGGSERLSTGLRLLAQNKAERVFVSGVHQSVNVERLLQLAGRPEDSLQQRVEAGHVAKDTRGNAEETATWMREHEFRSLRLVTSSYHMPRSLIEFREELPGVQVVSHPVISDQMKRALWWLRPRTAALLIGEYNKFLLTYFKYRWSRLSGTSHPCNGE
ncbi:MAG: YdcF family protein [Rhodospirillales bacterium]|nr:YdcF family protein [Rhodospirillales bacterium]